MGGYGCTGTKALHFATDIHSINIKCGASTLCKPGSETLKPF